jgi:2,4-dienoyl-CoA reductase (NADPH2)
MGREAVLAGAKEPVSVKLKRPVQGLLIAATGSPVLMGIADKLATAGPKASKS